MAPSAVAEVGRSSPGAPRHRAELAPYDALTADLSSGALVLLHRLDEAEPYASSASRPARARSPSDVALKRWAGRCLQHQAATALDRP
jgi:hypothetical protein